MDFVKLIFFQLLVLETLKNGLSECSRSWKQWHELGVKTKQIKEDVRSVIKQYVSSPFGICSSFLIRMLH